MENQMSFIDIFEQRNIACVSSNLKVVKALYTENINTDWEELFSGFDRLYAITFSSGIGFINKVLDKFQTAEIIFGCEQVMQMELAAVLSMQINSIQEFVRSKSAVKMAERLDDETLSLYVSRDTKSHEKIFIMESDSGRVRVITGSANMSASAFCGLQRENILCFDDLPAFEYYKNLFDSFKNSCSDHIEPEIIKGSIDDPAYLLDNIEKTPIVKTIEAKKIIILEENSDEDEDNVVIEANVKNLVHEIKPMLPKQKADKGKILISGEIFRGFKRKFTEYREFEKVKNRQLPKLHIDYETSRIDFNETPLNMYPDVNKIETDVKSLLNYLTSLNSFYGDVLQSQHDYFAFMNWFFASPFMPYLRYVASRNNYDVTPFPVFGILYGESNGGKSTFIRLLTKLMCGKKVPMNSSNDFTSTKIEALKRSCEGLPINIDDLARDQFKAHQEKVIKDDYWGIPEAFINYPAVSITTNKIASLPADISKRTVVFHIDTRINKEEGAKNSRKINESMNKASTALFSEYGRRMLEKIDEIENRMKSSETDYFPDIFSISSEILVDIISSVHTDLPEYIVPLSYTDYFGDKAIGRNAMRKIMTAWKSEPSQFKIDKKNNKIVYSYPEQGRIYELSYLQQELPPILNAQVTARTLIMDLDEAKKLFGISFRKRWFGWLS